MAGWCRYLKWRGVAETDVDMFTGDPSAHPVITLSETRNFGYGLDGVVTFFCARWKFIGGLALSGIGSVELGVALLGDTTTKTPSICAQNL
jgi:hypothetical protein